MLNANEGRIIKTAVNRSSRNILTNGELFPSSPPIKINKIPIIPKTIDEPMNIFVAIFCMGIL